jgi:hypothetical protein
MALENIRFVGAVSHVIGRKSQPLPLLKQNGQGGWYVASTSDDGWEYGEPASFATPEDEASYVATMKD